MSFVSLFFKKLKEKIGFRIMTKDEYELFLKEKRKSCFNSNMLGHSITSSAIDRSNVESNSINPATGLPISGGVDVGSNPYGVDLSSSFEATNPATGLSMSGGLNVGSNPYGVDLSSSFEATNPATGLPMSGGLDVGGNPYGVDLSSSFEATNPATGLPMSGGLDVGGNPYGVDLNSSFNHSFQDLSNSYHNDFHHD